VTTAFTGALTIKLTGSATGLDYVNAAGSLATLNVVGNMADIASNDTIIGGNGADALTLTADNNSTGADFTAVSKVETVTIVGAIDNDAKLTLGGDTTSLTIDASNMTNVGADFSLLGANYNGALTVTTGYGTDSVTGGAGADYISTGNGADVIVGGAGADSIYGGAGNDTITGGTGADYLNGGAGSDTYVLTGNGVVSLDRLEGFVAGTGNDVIQITAATGVSWGNDAIHYSSDGIASNFSILVLNDADSFASLAEATAYADQLFNMDTGDDANGGAYVFLWQDTSSEVHISYGTATAGTDSSKDMVKLVGVSMSTLLSNLVIGNIDLG